MATSPAAGDGDANDEDSPAAGNGGSDSGDGDGDEEAPKVWFLLDRMGQPLFQHSMNGLDPNTILSLDAILSASASSTSAFRSAAASIDPAASTSLSAFAPSPFVLSELCHSR